MTGENVERNLAGFVPACMCDSCRDRGLFQRAQESSAERRVPGGKSAGVVWHRFAWWRCSRGSPGDRPWPPRHEGVRIWLNGQLLDVVAVGILWSA
jgi:hypothetical protein